MDAGAAAGLGADADAVTDDAAGAGAAATTMPPPNTDSTTNGILRCIKIGIMAELVLGLVRDDVGHGLVEIGRQHRFAIRRVCRGARRRGNRRA